MAYTTAELIDILDREMRASCQGKRVLLSAEARLNADPVLALALGADKISNVYAFREFREQIHQYQREQGVSGLIWRTCQFQGHPLTFPELHNQLIAIPADLELLREAKADVLAFWRRVSFPLRLWLLGKEDQEITPNFVEELAREAEWAEVDVTMTEVYLGLCWGKPEERHCQWAFPESGCRRIVATPGVPSAIKV
ncbi:hypothetical protein VB712_09005 [Spirulina sp. CCNP1310]|uniref:hypothetical protein n=1 Tax=Spirulina sp. CCNP1310 TaxID=3110249 RepID=UPI002B1FEF29|nr:hypothetical protein [Spirulina sp. CCNP1310]MEA5419365.1 hypothetical protein [Spirulina sp. CCNP1310]